MDKNEHQRRKCFSIDIHKLKEISEPTTNCCIYRVPRTLRKINEEAYSPRLISIGPLHYQSSDDLMGMEKQKRSYLSDFEQRPQVGARKLEEFKTYVKNEEENIRTHYAVSSILGSLEYAEMVLCDSIFIIELFKRNYDGTVDFLLDKSQLRSYITLDLLLLENQLPYFVLDHIYSSAFPSRNPSFFALCLNFFGTLPMFEWALPEEPQVKHFTDLLRHSMLLEDISNSARAPWQSNNGEILVLPSATEDSKEIIDLPSATKLNESGLKFKKATFTATGKRPLLEITLRYKRKLWFPWLEETEVEIPCIEIYDEIEIFFRNVMALELFHYPTETYVCHYADLMNYLIDIVGDVELLAEQGIVANCVGDHANIAKMFKSLTSGIAPSPSNCYYEIARHMQNHYNNSWNRLKAYWNHLKATLKSVYFTDLWSGTATVGAIFLLILTMIQTVCSVMQVMPSS